MSVGSSRGVSCLSWARSKQASKATWPSRVTAEMRESSEEKEKRFRAHTPNGQGRLELGNQEKKKKRARVGFWWAHCESESRRVSGASRLGRPRVLAPIRLPAPATDSTALTLLSSQSQSSPSPRPSPHRPISYLTYLAALWLLCASVRTSDSGLDCRSTLGASSPATAFAPSPRFSLRPT